MEVSSATLIDQVYLSANIRALYRTRYHCDKKLKEIIENNPKADKNYIESFKKARSCGYVTNYVVDRIGDIEFKTCLCKFKHPLTHTLLTVCTHYEKGVMPFSGSFFEQPAQIIELLELVKSVKIEEEIEIQKKQAKGLKNGR
jgi:hypothetical protein